MYFAPSSDPLQAQIQRHMEFWINGEKREDVLACDTELGFALCLAREELTPNEIEAGRKPRWKRDRRGFRGAAAVELIWGKIEIRLSAPLVLAHASFDFDTPKSWGGQTLTEAVMALLSGELIERREPRGEPVT